MAAGIRPMIPLSADEIRIAAWLQRRAELHEAAAAKNPFTFHRVRAELCRKLAAAVKQGGHR